MSRNFHIVAAAAAMTVLLAPALASAQALFNAYPRAEYVQQWNNTMSGAYASATRATSWRTGRHAQRSRAWHAPDPSGERDAAMNFDVRRGNVM
jgi:hypothetical protein